MGGYVPNGHNFGSLIVRSCTANRLTHVARLGNSLAPEVRAAVFEIASVGAVLPRPVKAGDRFYLVRLASKTDPHERSLQEAERMIRVKLSQEKAHAAEARLLDELRGQFPVRIDEEALSQVKVE